MNRKDEDYLFNLLEDTIDITKKNNKLLKENNIMLKEIVAVLKHYLTHANEENENDFGRNILANMLSNFIELRALGNHNN